jgi:site-specific recombinase XerD
LPKQATVAEYEALINSMSGATWVDARDRLIVNVLFLCGLRRTEVANLAGDDFHTVEHVLHVRGGKGGRDRLVPLLPAVERALAEYVFVRPAVTTGAFLAAADGAGKARSSGLSSNAVYQLLRRRCRRAGLRMLNPHSFRHGLAMYLLNAGGDMSLVQKILGHAQITTTARHYAEWLTAGVVREYSERMHGVGR